jgi:hypothetical protein
MNTENNKLIAEFMNSKVTIDTYFINGMYLTTNETDLKYHSDWNWIFEVVEKIEKIGGVQIFINGISCEIIFRGKVISKHSNSKIEAVYNACIEFITWYNSQSVSSS